MCEEWPWRGGMRRVVNCRGECVERDTERKAGGRGGGTGKKNREGSCVLGRRSGGSM